MKLVLCAVIAYLLGSVCASIPLSKHCMGEDIRKRAAATPERRMPPVCSDSRRGWLLWRSTWQRP